MIVDVVIPVYHPGSEFREVLKRLSEQTLKIRSIILMHTEDGKDLSDIVGNYKNVVVQMVKPEEYDHGGTRDAGIRMSDADVVVCLTQDAVPADRNLIRNLTEPLVKEQAVASYARQLPKDDCKVIERYTRHFNYPKLSRVKSEADVPELGIKTYFCSNVCAAYNRESYLGNGGFEKKTIFNEDMIFAGKVIQAGCRVAYCADAKVFHSHNYSGRQQFKRNFDLAVSQADHPEIFKKVPSESEGIRLVKQTAVYLVKSRHPLKLVELLIQSGAKYMGYQIGKHYRILPRRIVLKCTMNPRYWGEYEKTRRKC